MKITAERLTDWGLVAECARTTIWKGALEEGKEPSEKFKRMILKCEHSPLRALMFKIRMEEVPTFVSVHFVRHKFGVEHFVSSNRPDRNGGNTDVTRYSPVNHVMVVNAQELLFMARRRLCCKASHLTQIAMNDIKEAIRKIDPIVAEYMVPMCEYRRMCPEPETCGYWNKVEEDLHGSY